MSRTEPEMNVELRQRSRRDREKINEVALLNERHFVLYASSIIGFLISTSSFSKIERERKEHR